MKKIMSGQASVTDPAAESIGARLKLRHLTLFRQVYDLQTLRKGADAAHMTQPAATKLIQELESLLGAQLFHRDRKGMTPTIQGQVVRRHVDNLMADLGNLRAELSLLGAGLTGQIRLGVIPSLSADLLRESVMRTLADRPQVRFVIKESAATLLLADLRRNELDLFFGRIVDADQGRGLRVTQIYRESYAIVCAATHTLARRSKVPWPEMAGYTWVLPQGGGPMRQLIDGLFTRHKTLRPVVSIESSSFEQIRTLVSRGPLLGILPRSMAEQARVRGELALLRDGLGEDFAPISLIQRQDMDLPPLIDAFANTVMDVAGQMSRQGRLGMRAG